MKLKNMNGLFDENSMCLMELIPCSCVHSSSRLIAQLVMFSPCPDTRVRQIFPQQGFGNGSLTLRAGYIPLPGILICCVPFVHHERAYGLLWEVVSVFHFDSNF